MSDAIEGNIKAKIKQDDNSTRAIIDRNNPGEIKREIYKEVELVVEVEDEYGNVEEKELLIYDSQNNVLKPFVFEETQRETI